MITEGLKQYLKNAIDSALLAGKEILDVYNTNFQIDFKEDRSPLTEADRRAHNVIAKSLTKTNIPLLSEEGKNIPYDERKDWETYWLVDPLDGTKEFISRNGEFTVNIALMNQGKPIAGVIYIPATDVLYFGAKEMGAYRLNHLSENFAIENSLEKIIGFAEKLPLNDTRTAVMVVASRSHLNEQTQSFIEKIKEHHPTAEIVSSGSSLKFCLIAEGLADVYPRFGTTMEWDIAAGHAIAESSGAFVVDEQKNEMRYNKKDLKNPGFVVYRDDKFVVGT
jgi:3'(2'), 5'-bisphosphate nucleotidase